MEGPTARQFLSKAKHEAWVAPPRRDRSSGDRYLTYVRTLDWAVVAGFVLVAISALAISDSEESDLAAGWISLGIFGVLTLYLFGEILCSRVSFDDSGLESRTLLRKTVVVPWSAIRRVRYGSINDWWILESEGHRTVRVSFLMRGIGEFSELLRERVPGTAFASLPPFLAARDET